MKQHAVAIPEKISFIEERIGSGNTLVRILKDADSFATVRLLRRGCRRYRFDKDLGPDSYYAGIDGGIFSPCYIRYPNRRRHLDMGNHYGGILFGIGNTNKAGGLIIPPIDVLRSQQLSFLKYQCLENDTEQSNTDEFRPVSEEDRNEFLLQQNSNFKHGRACHVLIENQNLTIDYLSLEQTSPNSWTGFRMMMPKLAGKIVPKGLIDEISCFLAMYPRDILPPTFALAMCIVWCRIRSDPDCQPELAVKKVRIVDGDIKRPVPYTDLAVFLLYSAHFFRFHEEHKLAAYGHIFRYADLMYKKDISHDKAFNIVSSQICEEKIIKHVNMMNLADKDWLEIVPPSWEGSTLTMPANSGPRAPRSKETTVSLMMPDIYTLGFPNYQNQLKKDYGDVLQEIRVHKLWVPKYVLDKSGVPSDEQQSRFSPKELRRYHKGNINQLWTVPVTEANLLSVQQQLILLNLLKEDMADDKNIAECLRPLKELMIAKGKHLTKSLAMELMRVHSKLMRDEVDKIKAFGQGSDKGHGTFTDQVLKPCCLLLGIVFPETPDAAMKAIGRLDEELDKAIATAKFLHSEGCQDARIMQAASQKLLDSQSLLYASRFILFLERLSGVELSAADEERWTRLFGQPYRAN
ncbi:uncharacterized protein CTRU02_213328 [Colletotrichum truncatum]|uniref:Uncharacterized protein n=1 Tax=Colletotrichum truncatum TaxID=5467 RepID=A0ACC3YKD7_COLTU|nr:uncharacterized protein CTRU02_02258 [Colletotrichum truncatum]KAF6798285.1 hypothetical protein CTRU02_02258 [Colletotrichum truncatum]